MPENLDGNQEIVRIGLLGASFDTGNMGVNALAESTIKCIIHRWPGAEVMLLDSQNIKYDHCLKINGREVWIRKLSIRFCKNIFLSNHFIVLFLYGSLFKVFRWERFKHFCSRRNESLKCLIQMDMITDITGGDSFSDIYGMRRFTIGFLRKCLVLLFNKRLIMLPQTYGPFKRPVAKVMARHILKKASLVYSRDKAGIRSINKLLNNTGNGKVRFSHDVAFVLDPHKPKNCDVLLSKISNTKVTIVGLNISGLLYNDGRIKNEMFGLKTDYRKMIYKIIDQFMTNPNLSIVLIPHVFPLADCEFESDPIACMEVYESMKEQYEDRLFLVQGECNHNEIKYLIGKCDFFIGSRMHACIAALSQHIPAVGIAYSNKFSGVFESIGLGNYIIDARTTNEGELLDRLKELFSRRDETHDHLKETMPQIKNNILNIFTVN